MRQKGYVLKPIYIKKVYNQNSKDKYTILAKDLDTGEVIEEKSTKLMGERLGTNKSNIISRLNQNKKAGLPLVVGDKRYLISRSDMNWPELKPLPMNKNKKILDKETNNIYPSLRKLAEHLKMSRKTLTKIMDRPDSRYVFIE